MIEIYRGRGGVGGGVGEFIDEFDVIRQPPFGDLSLETGDDVVGADLATFLADADQQRAFVPFGVEDADASGFVHAVNADSGIFQLDRADPFAARFDDVLGSVGNLHAAIRVEAGDIAGVEPAVLVRRWCIGLEIAIDDPGAAHLQIA